MPTFNVRRASAFTGRGAAGNGAGVLPLEQPLPTKTMQRIASIVGLAETAFTWPEGRGRRLRWFTPRKEVNLCGHATVATAFVLAREGARDATFRFASMSGPLRVRREPPWFELDFPALPPTPQRVPPAVARALGVDCVAAWHGGDNVFVELADATTVRNLAPNIAGLARAEPDRGVVITAAGDRRSADYVCRYFAPTWGVDEDSATGSIQCTLGPLWASKLGLKVLKAEQASPAGGRMRVRPMGSRVRIAGQARALESLDVPAGPQKG